MFDSLYDIVIVCIDWINMLVWLIVIRGICCFYVNDIKKKIF